MVDAWRAPKLHRATRDPEAVAHLLFQHRGGASPAARRWMEREVAYRRERAETPHQHAALFLKPLSW